MNQGLVYVFTGDGKGKTSAALGVAMRAAMHGMKVAMVQWYKDPSWRVSEAELPKFIPNFHLYPMGVGFKIPTKTKSLTTGQIVVDKASDTEHREAAHKALNFAQSLLGNVDLLILDEVNNALSDQLIPLSLLAHLINSRGSTHLLLTGRAAHPDIIKLADLVTEMKKLKHPYDQGIPALKGLDF